MKLVVEEVPKLRGWTVEWTQPGNHYLSRRNRLYHATDLDGPVTPVATIDAPRWRQLVARQRLAQRLLRFMVGNVLELHNGELFVTFDRSIGIVADGAWRPLRGLIRPCRVLRSGCSVDRHGDVYFGEYVMHTDPTEVHVYRYTPGTDTVEIVHTFPAGSILHVHGVYADPYSDALYCLTGDDAEQCQILRTTDGFATTEVIGERDETWRAVSLQFTADHIIYATDASLRANHIYRIDRRTMQREAIGEIDGPVLYSAQLGPFSIFGTSAEGAPSQHDDVATLWSVSDDATCRRIVSYRKDRWHRTLFKLGNIVFPYQAAADEALYFHLVALVGDNRTFRLRVDTR